jgi:hypothetical protein
VRIVALFIFLLPSACTLYQSDGRQAIEKNKANIVGAYGFDTVSKTHYECYLSAEAPSILHAQNEVLDTEFEKDGFSSLETHGPDRRIIVYKFEEARTHHHYCILKVLEPAAESKASAIRLAVNLLVDQMLRSISY